MTPSTKDSTYLNQEQLSRLMSLVPLRGSSDFASLSTSDSIVRWVDRSSKLRFAIVPTEALAKCVGRTKGAS